MIRRLLAGLATCLLAAQGLAQDTTAAGEFNSLLDEHWRRAVQEQVFFRTDADSYRLDGKLAEVSIEARARRRAFNDYLLERLEEIDGNALQGQDRLSYKLFRYEREAERESYRYPDHLFPITRLSGYHSYFAQAPAKMAFNTLADYQRYLVSLADFPRYNREHIELLKEGVRTGYTQYCESMVGYEKTISEQLVERPRDSALYAPFKVMPATFTAAQQADLRKLGQALIAEQVIPAYRKLYAFFTEQYMPACRSEAGISSLEGGADYININDPATKPLYNLEALTLHEAVPGHHHQTALAMELDLPEFRKTAYHAAFGEGWGLYSERLGLEAGFYTDPYSNFGRLTYEMWRANRLVIDTGIHAFGWSRQQAIDYLLANSALTRQEVVAEIDRYITWPGQATAYKIGELKIRALRARAENALGPDGSVPIAVLEEMVDDWIAGQLQ